MTRSTVPAAPDVLVIGAGPAGMTAAMTAAKHGAETILLDEQPSPGGQIYRSLESVLNHRVADKALLGKDYIAGGDLIQGFRASYSRYIHSATVWNIDLSVGRVLVSVDNRTTMFEPQKIILANGAMERSVPFPGWTLPGVFGAGAAQILLKSAGHVPDGHVVLFGSGPLLLLVADQLSRAGVERLSVLETTGLRDYVAAAPLLLAALRKPSYILKGLRMRSSLRRNGVKVISGVTSLVAEGDERVQRVVFEKSGITRSIPADVLLVHEGIIPNTQLTRLIGADHEWVHPQSYWQPKLTRWGETSRAGVFVAGDGGGVEGAEVAAFTGQLCGLEALHQLGRLSEQERDVAAQRCFRGRHSHKPLRTFLDKLYPPPIRLLTDPPDATTICRCWEVTAGAIKEASKNGCHTPDELKSSLRCGMGPCQGRVCGPSVGLIMSAILDQPPEDTGYFNIRAPIKPISLGELASLESAPCRDAG